MRTVIIHRAGKITGPYEGRLALQYLGIAQGGLIDTPDGRWFAYLFRDYGAVGRIPYLVPVTWQDGWPVLGVDGKVPDQLNLPANSSIIPGIVAPDDFDRRKGDTSLPLAWQWNHNPDNTLWSLTKHPGFLRLITGRIDTSLLSARNTLTQRTFGPVCNGSIAINVSHMKDGDVAGLCLLQKNYGYVAIKSESGKRSIIMVNAATGASEEAASIPLQQETVFLKATCDFTNMKDTAGFFYSLDDRYWMPLGTPLRMSYTLPHFMGYRFGIFNYATRQTGGYVDIDWFRIE